MNLLPVILCGGSGTRLWPLSRAMYPKQLLDLVGEESLLQATVRRLEGMGGPAVDPLVICNEAHRFLVDRQLMDIGCRPQLLLEPEGRNTAPAAAIAALLARQQAGADVLLLVLPADHVVRNPAAFAVAVATARTAAEQGDLVTFGVVPTSPETGYGYINAEPISAAVRPVQRFVEKPDHETARRYVQSGAYLWNSGMFLFSADAYLGQLRVHAPDVLMAAEQAMAGSATEDRCTRPDREGFLACRTESIDYAVMEKTDRAVVVALDAGWSDVGSWSSLLEVSARDGDGNTVRGDVIAIDCRDSYLRSENRLLGVIGLEGCVVVETRDAVLVAPRERAQDVKKLADALERRGRPEARLGREVFRPWGSFDSLDGGPGFQVKRLSVLPGGVLSLQMHHRRAEHWVVVSGTARITRDQDVFDLGPNQYTFIPLGARHRIENPGTSVLRIIEVQVGEYLGEDDIVRFEDRYGRQGRTD